MMKMYEVMSKETEVSLLFREEIPEGAALW
jgi:hypothetical protein